ncbi:hypothetical protein CsSME_00031510 [Camellia sinensis var. sinensis]
MLVDMRSHSSSANLLCFSHVGVLLSSKRSSLSLPRISSNRTFGPHRPSSSFHLKLSGSGVGKHVFRHRISQVRAMDEVMSRTAATPRSFWMLVLDSCLCRLCFCIYVGDALHCTSANLENHAS